MDEGAAHYIERIGALDSDEELKLLEYILTQGYDQGCFLRPASGELLPVHDPEIAHAVLAALKDRVPVQAKVKDPFESTPLAASAIEGDAAGYVILTQRCDLIRPLVTEPFVELAYAEFISDPAEINEAKKLSNRKLHLADCESGGAWALDLRRRAVMPKDCLPEHSVVQPIADMRMRKYFKLRVSQRYSRDPLPDDVRERIRPLIVFLRKNTTNIALSEPFTNFFAYRLDGKVLIHALHPPHIPVKAADDAWQAIEDALGEEFVEANIHPESNPISMEDFSFAMYLDGWLLDVGDISVDRKAAVAHEMPSV